MALLDALVDQIATQRSLEEKVELLVSELARQIKATSNDQNIQKLSRELKAAQPALVRAIADEVGALHLP